MKRLEQFRQPVVRVARRSAIPFGRVTSPIRILPEFLIVGAQRAGTTSLYKYLAAHPDVGRVRFGKGVHYFDTNYGRSLGWYQSHFPLDASRLPLVTGPSVVGEGAPYYMFHPECASRINETLPAVRIIAILRDPIERAHSQWVHETARGFETLPFEEALLAEPGRLMGADKDLVNDAGTNFSHQHHSYVARGQYAEQIERLWRVFGRERVLVLSSTRLFGDPAAVYGETLAFLGLRPHETTYEVHNARSYASIDPRIKAQLGAEFSASNEALVEMLGPEFDFRRD